MDKFYKALMLALGYTLIALAAIFIGLLEALLWGELRGPTDTYGGLVGIAMLASGVPVIATYGAIVAIREALK